MKSKWRARQQPRRIHRIRRLQFDVQAIDLTSRLGDAKRCRVEIDRRHLSSLFGQRDRRRAGSAADFQDRALREPADRVQPGDDEAAVVVQPAVQVIGQIIRPAGVSKYPGGTSAK